MVYVTQVCMGVRASTHPILRMPSSSGGMRNHPTPSLQTPFRLSQPPDLLPHPRPPNHKAKKRKRRLPKPAPPRLRSLLVMSKVNINAQRRIRQTHTKFCCNQCCSCSGQQRGWGGRRKALLFPLLDHKQGRQAMLTRMMRRLTQWHGLFPNQARNWPVKYWAYIPLLSRQVFQYNDL